MARRAIPLRAIGLGIIVAAATLVVAAVALRQPAVEGPLRAGEPFQVSIPVETRLTVADGCVAE